MNEIERELERDDSRIVRFVDRLPSFFQLFPSGGVPGFEYAMVHPEQLPTFRRMKDKDGHRWEYVKMDKEVILEGPKGEADVVVLCRGKKLSGVHPMNGKRPFFVSQLLLDATGITEGVEDGEEDEPSDAEPEDSVGESSENSEGRGNRRETSDA